MKDTKKTLSNNIETVASSFPTVAKRIREDCNILLEEKEEQLTATGTALKSYKAENKELNSKLGLAENENEKMRELIRELLDKGAFFGSAIERDEMNYDFTHWEFKAKQLTTK